MSLNASEEFSRLVIRQLSKLREEKGITKEGLAKASGISRSMISMMESQQRHPTLVTLHALSNSMGVSLAKVVASAEAEKKSSPSKKR